MLKKVKELETKPETKTVVYCDTIIIYHGLCIDGTSGAWILQKYLKPCSVISGRRNTDENFAYLQDKDIYFVDFIYDLEQMLQIETLAKSITIIDHHETTKKIIEELKIRTTLRKISLYMDEHRCGAQLAYDYVKEFKSNKLPDVRPWFIDDIGDKDLWTWKRPNSKYTVKAMETDKFNMKIQLFDTLTDDDTCRQLYIEKGVSLEKTDNLFIEKSVNDAQLIKCSFDNVEYSINFLSINTQNNLVSEMGNALCIDEKKQGIDFAVICIYMSKRDEYKISLRAIKDIDLTQIAKHFGGGGHKKASGGTIKTREDIYKIFGKVNLLDK